jgi:hypothetical protein
MSIVAQFSWDDIADPAFENPTRKIWRDAVAEIGERAKQTLPQCNGRVDAAIKIVLAGDVELLPDGKAKVASQSNGTTKYFIVNGECACKDYPKAPSFWCKHRIAAKLEQQNNGVNNGTTESATAQPQVQAEPATPPVEAPVESEPGTPTVEASTQSEQAVAPAVHTHREAPSSCNTFIEIAGRKVQLTLRDDNEENLLSRMEKLLSRFPLPAQEPAVPESAPTPPENWCPIHHVPMKRYSNAKGSWFSHKTPEGTWCNGKNGKGK